MKNYFKLLVLLFIFFTPINIYAYNLTCDNSSHKVGDIFSCKISGDNISYDKLSGTIASDDSISCKRASVASGLEVLSTSTDSFFDLSGNTSSNDLVILSCQVITNPDEATNATVYVNDFTYHASGSGIDEATEILRSDFIKLEHKDETGPIDNKPRDISDSSLRPRRLTSKELDITFSQFITEYSVEVLYETEEVTFDYELNDPTSTLRIEGNTKLQVGNNIIDIYITNADGSKEACYTFHVERLARGEKIYYPESDSSLKSMVVPGYSIGFNKDVLEYKIHLTRDVNSININTIPNYEKATVSINNTDNLKNGDIIAIEVTSADETSKTTYKISITKDAPKKDYSTIIIISLLVVAFIGTIAMFIITNNKKKKDPLLSIKTNKRKINKGKNFDSSIVPESTNSQIDNNMEQTKQVNTLNLNNENTVSPIQTDKIVVDSFNRVSSTAESLNLNNSISQAQDVGVENINASAAQVPNTNPGIINTNEQNPNQNQILNTNIQVNTINPDQNIAMNYNQPQISPNQNANLNTNNQIIQNSQVPQDQINQNNNQ